MPWHSFTHHHTKGSDSRFLRLTKQNALFTQSCQLFPEIAEDAAVYFHMDEKRTDFEEQFETFYYLDGIEKKKLIEKQNERLKHFSWKKSALELANIYKHIN